MNIRGVEGMPPSRFASTCNGARGSSCFSIAFSALAVTFRRPSDIYLIRAEENAAVKGLPFTLLTLVLGWWGIPWGPVYRVQPLITNLGGGKNVTSEIMAGYCSPASPAPAVRPV